MPETTPIYDLVLLLSTTAPEEQRAKILADVETAIPAARWIDRAPATTGAPGRSRSGSTTRPRRSTTCSSSPGPPSLLESLSHSLRIADGVLRFRIIKVLPGTPPAPDSPPPVIATAAAVTRYRPPRRRPQPAAVAEPDA